MMHLLNPSPIWFPYFGNQRRFVPYVKELMIGLGAKEGDTIFETNAGSHAISYHLVKDLNMKAITNDLGFYSQNIGLSLTGDSNAIRLAAKGAALVEEYGFGLQPRSLHPSKKLIIKWIDFISQQEVVHNYKVIRGNLFTTIQQHKAKFIYCDFAWPWKNGSYTKEYEVTVDSLGTMLGDTEKPSFELATARRILQDVIAFLDEARKHYQFVILSNQSSNYPTPEVLEAHLRACNHTPIISRRLTVLSEHVDNLGKEPFFTEYQYVFDGDKP
jgi:hypothetical protein